MEVGGELGEGVTAPGHAVMRNDHLPPWLEAGGRRTHQRGGVGGRFAGLRLELQTHQLFLGPADLGRLTGIDSHEETLDRIQSPVRVVHREGVVVRPFVAHVPQLEHQVAVRTPQLGLERCLPRLGHHP